MSVGVPKADSAHGRNPVDGAAGMLLADPEGNLECNLRHPNAIQAYNGSFLTII